MPCTELCCSAGSEISQPTNLVILKKTERCFGLGKNARKRSFVQSWYKQFPWIHLCCTKYKVYCFHCKCAYDSSAKVASSKADQAFTTVGISNWKKAVERFKEHESSHAHRNLLATSQSKQVNQLLLKELEQSQSKQRCSLIKQLAALRYLLRQGLSIRNDHAGGSNLSVLLETVLEENNWVSDKKYQSPEIINIMIEIMAHKVLRSVLAEISSHSWFSLLADETRDISNREQLVLCLRWVLDHYEIFEDQIGLIQLDNTTAETIYSSLKDSLLRLGIPFDKC